VAFGRKSQPDNVGCAMMATGPLFGPAMLRRQASSIAAVTPMAAAINSRRLIALFY
jgi:hypothetical protein